MSETEYGVLELRRRRKRLEVFRNARLNRTKNEETGDEEVTSGKGEPVPGESDTDGPVPELSHLRKVRRGVEGGNDRR